VLKKADGVSYVHDADGNMIEKVLPDGKKWAYQWDGAGQLREVVRPDGQVVSFAYDALGRRVRKTAGDQTTVFMWDGNDVAHELRPGIGVITWEFEPETFAPVAKIEGTRCYGVVTDHHGTPFAVFDEVGEIAWRTQLDVFGVVQTDVMDTSCSWRWPGQYDDQETGLHYNRFRYYDPQTNTYISQDPVGVTGGMSLYSYVLDPLKFVDPLGLSKNKCGAGGFRHGMDEDEIIRINRLLGGTTELTGSVSSIVAAAERRTGFWNKAAAMVREIAGRHMFNDANKRTAQGVVEALMSRNKIVTGVGSAEMKSVIHRVATGELREVDDIARALRGF
jgi:RHS repeat-associated protein